MPPDTSPKQNTSRIFPRVMDTDLPTAAGGEGCYIIDTAGRRYLDGSGGAAVSCLGHGHPAPAAAIRAQLDTIAYAHTGFFTSAPAESLAALLAGNAPRGMNPRVYFLSGGSEAVEAAIKLARQYFLERGEATRTRIISRRQSYHGNTLGALAAGGNMWRRKPFEPLLAEAALIPPCYAYRGMEAGEDEAAYGLRCADALEAEILRLGPENVMAFIAETVVGATLGAVPAARGYFRRVREICDKYGVLLILDEVMCGMGRTGHFFACEAEGRGGGSPIAPDIITIAKGLGGGYQPIGAMLASCAIYDTIKDGTGAFRHGHTYMGHPLAVAAGLAVVETILEQKLPAQVVARGDMLMACLQSRLGDHHAVGDIRGRGLFIGIEFVEDRATKKPFDPGRAMHARLKAAAFAAGLVCYPMGGTVDGRHGDHVLLAPPFIISEAECEALVEMLAGAVDEVFG